MRSRGVIWLVLGLCLCRPGWADIYAYTDADGAVSLSNVPTDARYAVLIASPKQAVAAAPATPPAASAPTRQTGLARKAGYEQVVDAVSRTHGLESALLHAVISVESRYNPKAVSRKGAAGLMQLMPQTAKRYGVADAFDPLQHVVPRRAGRSRRGGRHRRGAGDDRPEPHRAAAEDSSPGLHRLRPKSAPTWTTRKRRQA